MSSIFQTTQNYTSDPIDDVFLKSEGFNKITWGNPHDKTPGYECYERFIDIEKPVDQFISTDTVEIYYFPNDFNRYVTPFNSRGENPANKVLAFSRHRSNILTKEVHTKSDLSTWLDEIINFFNK